MIELADVGYPVQSSEAVPPGAVLAVSVIDQPPARPALAISSSTRDGRLLDVVVGVPDVDPRRAGA